MDVGLAGGLRPFIMVKAETGGPTLFEYHEKQRYADTKFLSAKQKEKAYKCFTKVLKGRDINKMDRNLYEYLSLHCGDIAHYDIHGYKAYYSGQDFREFIERFDRNSKLFAKWHHWVNGEHADLNRDMVELATSMAQQIYAELDQKQRASEIALCKALAEKHNLKGLDKGVCDYAVQRAGRWR